MKTSGGSDGGFTLIEVLVATTVLGMVMAAVAGVLIMLMNTQPVTDARYWQSHDSQMLAAYWGTDVQSADNVSAGVDAYGCTAPGSITNLVEFQWTTRDGTSMVKVASYQSAPVAGKIEVTRTYCVNGATKASTVVLHGLASPPNLSCVDGSPCKLAATSPATVVHGQPISSFPYSVQATRRTS